mmetsp:Transcript_13969/g.30564  ORF Transcript_13969/g.30564 Transcript_13969/m.30564 type:complete len:183 (+) Transcript_13969:153-701(+)
MFCLGFADALRGFQEEFLSERATLQAQIRRSTQNTEKELRHILNLTRRGFEDAATYKEATVMEIRVHYNKLYHEMIIGALIIAFLGFLFLCAISYILFQQHEARRLEFAAKITELQDAKKDLKNELVVARQKLDEVTDKYHDAAVGSKNDIIQQMRMPTYFPPIAFAGEPSVVSGGRKHSSS